MKKQIGLFATVLFAVSTLILGCKMDGYTGGLGEMVLIPSGTFQMGSNQGVDANKPVHEVTITKSFYIGKYEITQAEYEKYCSYGENKPNSRDGIGKNHPAYYVSWYDALVYCNKRSIAEGLTSVQARTWAAPVIARLSRL